jgi:hypothetical protein
MSSQYLTRMEEPQVPPYPATDMAQGLYADLARFLAPLLIELDARIDCKCDYLMAAKFDNSLA